MEKETKKSGFLVINKPTGITSHDVIDQLRRITGIKKIGHAGTLDPFASGVLIVAVGREATREISKYVKLDKTYVATLYLGAVSGTYDLTGVIKKSSVECRVSKPDAEKVLNKFMGKQKQVPPMFSAKKVKGKRLYKLARKGIEIEREPVEINVYDIELLSYEWPRLKIKIKCSSGTYIRSIAHDIGGKLGCGAYVEELERTAVGEFNIRRAQEVRDINLKNWHAELGL